MSVQRHTVQDPPDLETTAELPVLDVAAYEATEKDALTPAPAAEEPPLSIETPQDSLRSHSSHLEEDLKSLSAHLREVEERLTAQGAGAATLERQLESTRAGQAAAEQRAESLSRELTDARNARHAAEARLAELTRLLESREAALHAREAQDGAVEAKLAERDRALARTAGELHAARLQASAQHEVLESLEGRRAVFEALLHELDSELSRRDTRVTELERGLDSGAERVRALETELSVLQRDAGELAGQVQSLERALASKSEDSDALARANDELRRNVASLTESAASSAERLQAAEADARARAEAHGRELEAAVARQRELETAEGDGRRERAAAREEQERRRAALEAELVDVRAQLAERTSALAQLEADGTRLKELEARVDDYAKAALAFQAELAESRERGAAADSDLRAAEAAILRLEGELRAKSGRIDELLRLNDDWRGTLEAARRSIEERDALIRRLEKEAAHSTALLDNIQHSIRSLEAAPANRDEPPPASAAIRLLVRTEGESEVVHVLGRKTTIGRTPDNDVQVDTKFVSRHHAVVLAGPVHTIIEDLNSTNGVAVNGERVTRRNLKDGDAIIIGNAQFRFAVRPASERRSA
ncbi:MAG TPA: FHA domain-containing protein [Steroidobacteraceae bacterium]|nr:FHA domain-containing protein [Steroidobacteraceae bacterium]